MIYSTSGSPLRGVITHSLSQALTYPLTHSQHQPPPPPLPSTMASKPANGGIISSLFASPTPLYTLAITLRIVLLLYGLWQDANSPLKYTDIDYLVFTDAARFVSQQHPEGPYARETYRYTPLLAWMLLPTTWTAPSYWLSVAFFSFGKILFAVADLVAGWLIVEVLTMRGGGKGNASVGMDAARARKFATIWLLNPMVATISTRGSSEGLLAVMVMALLWAVLSRKVTLAALLLGFGVHFKIYPFIYAPAIVWWMDDEKMAEGTQDPVSSSSSSFVDTIAAFLTASRLKLALLSLITFVSLNLAMHSIYGHPFLLHTYLHHVTRIDHRHNFSPYNILLYLTSAQGPGPATEGFHIESLAFLPQLLLSCVIVPLVMAKKDLPTTMLVQTWTFVTFNKVCTSQVCNIYIYIPSSFTIGLHRHITNLNNKKKNADRRIYIVFPLVHDFPPPLSTSVLAPQPPKVGYFRPRAVGA